VAIILKDQRLIVLLVPGTGSTSIESALLGIPSAQSVGNKHDTFPELLAKQAILSEEAKNFLCVCFVRNHFDILHAEWHRSRTRWVFELDDPESWLAQDEFKRLQIKMCCAKDFSDYIIWQFQEIFDAGIESFLFTRYTERSQKIFFSEKISDFVKWLRDEYSVELNIDKSNATSGRSVYWQSYSKLARTIIETVYKSELAQFSYVF